MKKQESNQSTSLELQLTSRDKGLIKECLLMVAKMQGVAPDQMKELLSLHDKIEM